jgi:hypothetical protein
MYDYFNHPNPGLRIGDAEREKTAEILRDAHAAGRLDAEEFQERLDRCLAAKTDGELRQLVQDLPGVGAPEHSRGSAPGYFRVPLRWVMPAVAVVVAISVIGAVIHAAFHLIIPVFILLFIARICFFGPRRRAWHAGW